MLHILIRKIKLWFWSLVIKQINAGIKDSQEQITKGGDPKIHQVVTEVLRENLEKATTKQASLVLDPDRPSTFS